MCIVVYRGGSSMKVDQIISAINEDPWTLLAIEIAHSTAEDDGDIAEVTTVKMYRIFVPENDRW